MRKFEELPISTSTIMIYTNMSFDRQKIFDQLQIGTVPPVFTKKKKTIDKSKLESNSGTILSVQNGIKIKGLILKKAKKHKCRACKNTSIIEKYSPEGAPNGTDIDWDNMPRVIDIRYFCTKCELYFTHIENHSYVSFLNQNTIILNIGEIMVNIMLFNNSMKVAGCKTIEHAISVCKILWDTQFSKMTDNAWTINNCEDPSFFVENVMTNIDFKIDYHIDRSRLNELMNSDKFKSVIYESTYESTSNTNVNIKMKSSQPSNFSYQCIKFSFKNDSWESVVTSVDSIDAFKPKKTKKQITNTFIIFSSGETILSGRFLEDMEKSYYIFNKILDENRSDIEEMCRGT